MRYFVFNSRAGALLCAAAINNRMRELFAARGYTVTTEGIVGKRLDGTDNPNSITKTWAVPVQLMDGRWAIPHPEQHPLRFKNFADRTGAIAGVIRDRTSDNIQEESPEWWPAPPPEVPDEGDAP